MNQIESRIGEAIAFVAMFARSSWKDCHVRTGAVELFIARELTANPMRAVQTDVTALIDIASVAGRELCAPHIGTVISLADVGASLAAGAPYAEIELLGETIVLTTEAGGTVLAQMAPIGSLVEFDQPLLSLN